ncbi:hypothetical protein [Lysobacter sp. CA199]|uniref:hypothetical protein n=1 Tax=Lysobacter sp. CA199 TaxID=3455608 RepID=UPI003F8CF71D
MHCIGFLPAATHNGMYGEVCRRRLGSWSVGAAVVALECRLAGRAGAPDGQRIGIGMITTTAFSP